MQEPIVCINLWKTDYLEGELHHRLGGIGQIFVVDGEFAEVLEFRIFPSLSHQASLGIRRRQESSSFLHVYVFFYNLPLIISDVGWIHLYNLIVL